MSERDNTGVVLLGAGLVAAWFFLTGETSDDPQVNYIVQFWNYAKNNENAYNIPHQFTLAQAIDESASGTSDVAIVAKNHFGIKDSDAWTGLIYKGYRAYPSVAASYNDNAAFLTNNSRYKPAFNYTDAKQFAQAISNAGYSQDASYYNKLAGIINKVNKVAADNNLT